MNQDITAAEEHLRRHNTFPDMGAIETDILMVQAYDLLEALKACEAALANLRRNNRWDVHPEDFNDDVDEAVDAQEQARRVIARAEGRAE